MTTNPIIRLYKLIKLERRDLIILPIIIFGYGLLSIATPVSVQALVNIVTMGSVLQPLYVISLVLFLLLLLSGALYVFESYIVELIQRRFFIRTAVQAAKNARGVDISLYDKENPVELINRFFDVGIVQKSAASLLTISLTALLQIVIGSLILIFYSVYFALVIFLIIGALYLIINTFGQKATETAILESKAKYKTASWLEEIAKNILAFKFYSGTNRTASNAYAMVNDYVAKRSNHFHILIWQNITAAIIYAIGGTLLLALGGGLVIKGEINLGQFVAAELIIFGVLAALIRLVSKLSYFYDLIAALDKVGILEDMPQEPTGEHSLEGKKIQSIKVDSISFSYNKFIKPLENISFQISQGESMAILGNPGSGKSTLLKLICKLRTPDKGVIRINDTDLRLIENDAIRDQMGLAGAIEIANGSILENICLGREIPLSKVNAINNELGLDQEFNLFADGLNTNIAASGSPLSGSQLQRLMIARATVGSPDLVMIDGVLDNFNEKELDLVMQLFAKHRNEWMLIVATRFNHIAERFNKTLDLNNKKT